MIPNNLIVLEIANNHMGDVEHGIELINHYSKIVKKYSKIFSFAFKFQFRQLDTFIHPDYKNSDLPYVKRFKETKLSDDDFKKLFDVIRKNNHHTMVTCFDNDSLKKLSLFEVDILKVASCSFTDWPLLEELASLNLPVIASCAGATEKDLEHVVTFMQNRISHFALLHCIAEYPCPQDRINLNQLDYLKLKFPQLRVGFSTHEDPSDYSNVAVAYAKGATIFEKHIALPNKKYKKNAYSTSPEEFINWLEALSSVKKSCGNFEGRYKPSEEEKTSLLSLQRGIYAKKNIRSGDIISFENSFLAFPPIEGQYTAQDFSKYTRIISNQPINKNEPISSVNASLTDSRSFLDKIENDVQDLLNKANISLPKKILLEISHHYGLDKFHEYGMCIFTLINRTYCKKLLILFGNQKHPPQFHKNKEETFRLLYGDINLKIDDRELQLNPGELETILPNQVHEFSSKNGCVIEEISSTHEGSDSYYTDHSINQTKNRKTIVTFYQK